MKCPTCGATLQVQSNQDQFSCAYCGSALTVARHGGTVALIVEGISKVQVGTDKTAAELALVRLRNELAENALAMESHMESMPPPYEPEIAPGLTNSEFGFLLGGAALAFGAMTLSIFLALIVAAVFVFAVRALRSDRLRIVAHKNESSRRASEALHQEFNSKLVALYEQNMSVGAQIEKNRIIVGSSQCRSDPTSVPATKPRMT